MIGSGAAKHKSHTYWDRDIHTASASAFWWQVRISFLANQGQSVTCAPRQQDGALLCTSAITLGSCLLRGEFKAGALKNLHWRGLLLVFPPQCDTLSSLTGPERQISPIWNIRHKAENTKCFRSCRRRYEPLPLCSTGKTSGKDQGFSLAEHSDSLEEKVKVTPKPAEHTKTTRGIYEEPVYGRVQSQIR